MLRLRRFLPPFLSAFLKPARNEGDRTETRIEPAVLFYIEWIASSLSLIFDVGAHTGQFTRSMMQVLPQHVGIVLFEADPRHAAILKALNTAHSRILQVVPKAVYRASNETIKFLQCAGEASHVVTSDNQAAVDVPTIALDDFIFENSIQPDLIKIDAEGSEYDIMNGAIKYLRLRRPIVIFEDCDLRAATFMRSLGYELINTATALSFEPSSGNSQGRTLNLFAYDPAYAPSFGVTALARTVLATGPLSKFCARKHSSPGLFTSVDFAAAMPQKLLVEFAFAQQLQGDMKIEYLVDGKVLGCYGGSVTNIMNSYTSCPLHVPARSRMQFKIYTQAPLDWTANMVNLYALHASEADRLTKQIDAEARKL